MTVIPMKRVKSAAVHSVGYDFATRTLAVNFHGTVYHYADVPPDVHQAMLGAKSIGAFVHARLKGKFAAAKQEPEKRRVLATLLKQSESQRMLAAPKEKP